jgi:hypothetical protein
MQGCQGHLGSDFDVTQQLSFLEAPICSPIRAKVDEPSWVVQILGLLATCERRTVLGDFCCLCSRFTLAQRGRRGAPSAIAWLLNSAIGHAAATRRRVSRDGVELANNVMGRLVLRKLAC